MNLTRSFDAESEALSLADVKNHLRITTTDDDDALRSFIAGIRHRTEWHLLKTLVTSTWVLRLDSFYPKGEIALTVDQYNGYLSATLDDEICLPMGPVQSITSVEYVDTDGATQTLSSSLYQFDSRGRLKPAYGTVWPATRAQYDAVTVTYKAGVTHAGNVAEDIKLAMLMWIGACDINRENIAFTQVSEIPAGAKSILAPHRDLKI